MLVYVECKPDKALLSILLEDKKRIKHGKCKSEIIKLVWKRSDIVGVVDRLAFGT